MKCLYRYTYMNTNTNTRYNYSYICMNTFCNNIFIHILIICMITFL